MEFKNWLESSYSTINVPNIFYVIGDFTEDSASQLGNFFLAGISGISDNEAIIKNFMGVARDMMVVMDGQKTEIQNKLTRIMYSKPEYLVSNNMTALKRIWSRRPNDPNNRIYQNLIQYIGAAGKQLGTETGTRVYRSVEYDGGYAIGKQFPTNVSSIKDIAQWLFQGSQHTNWNIKNFTIQDAYTIIIKALEIIGHIYKDEGEWVLKNKTLQIPEQAQIYLLVPSIEKDKWRQYLDTKQVPYWERSEFEKMYQILELLHKNSLFKKYKMNFIPAVYFNKIGIEKRNLQNLQSMSQHYPIIGY